MQSVHVIRGLPALVVSRVHVRSLVLTKRKADFGDENALARKKIC